MNQSTQRKHPCAGSEAFKLERKGEKATKNRREATSKQGQQLGMWFSISAAALLLVLPVNTMAFEVKCETSPLIAEVNQAVKLQCKAELNGDTLLFVQWKKNDTTLEKYLSSARRRRRADKPSRFELKKHLIGNGDFTLFISSVEKSDKGTYEYAVASKADIRKGSMQLEVKENAGSKGTSDEGTSDPETVPLRVHAFLVMPLFGALLAFCSIAIAHSLKKQRGVTVSSAIEILLSPQSLSILLGQTARFTCSIGKGMGCHKDVCFFWSHNETQINNTVKNINRRISTIDSNLSSSLFIANVTPSDHGQYSCSVLCLADPPLLLEKRSAQLEVKVKAIPKLDLRSAVSADRAAVLILSCSAVGFYPRDVTLSWDSSFPGLSSSTQQGPPTVNQDGSYSTSTSLQVNEALWSPGTEISCVLNHSSLAQPNRKGMRKPNSKKTIMFNQYLYTLLLPALLLPCCVYLLMKALRNCQAADPASCGDKEMGKEEDGGLHYASVTHRHRKQQKQRKQRRMKRTALEDGKQAVYSAVRGREGAAAASEDSLQYASLDLHSIPRRTTNEEDQQCTVYASAANRP